MIRKEEDRLQNNWRKRLMIFDNYKKQQKLLVMIITRIVGVLDDHVRQGSTAEHRTVLKSDRRRSLHAAICQEQPKLPLFTGTKISQDAQSGRQ